MKKTQLKPRLAILFLLASAPALACNNLRFDSFPSSVDFTANASPSFTFTLKRNGNPGCSFYVACSNNDELDAGSYAARSLAKGADTVPVQLCIDGACTTICKTRGEASASEVVSGTIAFGGANPTLTIYPRLGALDYPAHGAYSRKFSLRLYEGAFNANSLEESRSFELLYSPPKTIDLSLVETGSPFNAASTSKTLNFGTFSTSSSVQRTADLVLKYNAGYRVLMKSDGAGNLRKDGTGPQQIPYSLTLDGAGVSLGSSFAQVASGGGSSPAGGRRLPIVATVGAIPPAQAPGTYSDSVYVQVETTE